MAAGPAAEVVVTVDGPDSKLNYRSGDESAMWLSTFVTDSSGQIIPYVQSDLEFWYSSTADTTLVSGSATAMTRVNLNYLIPTQASVFSYQAKLPSTLPGRQAFVYSDGGDTVTSNDDTGNESIRRGTIPIFNSAHAFQYSVSASACTLTVAATGFRF